MAVYGLQLLNLSQNINKGRERKIDKKEKKQRIELFHRVARGRSPLALTNVGETNGCWEKARTTPSFAPTNVKLITN